MPEAERKEEATTPDTGKREVSYLATGTTEWHLRGMLQSEKSRIRSDCLFGLLYWTAGGGCAPVCTSMVWWPLLEWKLSLECPC